MKVKVYEWLKGDGNAYIDTNIMPSQSLEWEIKAQITYTDKRDECLFGARSVAISSSYRSYVAWFNTFYDYPSYDFRAFDKQGTENKKLDNEPHIFSLKDSIGYCDGNVVKTYDTSAFHDLGVNIGLFALIRNDYVDTRRFSGRIAYFKTDTLHLVPCLTSDNEACMLDLLSGELYRNQGSGNFSVEGECLYEFETPVIKQVMRKPNVVVRLRGAIRANNRAQIEIPFTPNNFSIRAKYDAEKIIHGYSARIWAIAYQGANDNIGLSSDSNGTINTNAISQYLTDGTGASATNLPSDTSINDVTIRQNGTYTINGIDGTYTPRVDYNVPYRLTIFNVYAGSDRAFKGLVNFIEVRNGSQIINLYPCDILYHPTLPPQSAMIDPSTGTIYTNQGSGNFTCEGEDLGIWTDTLYDDMRIKDVKADMVCIMQDGEPRVVYERTQPWEEHKWLTFDIPTYPSSQFNGPLTIPITYAKFKASGTSGNAGLLLTRDSLENPTYKHAATLQVASWNEWRIWSTDSALNKAFSSKSDVISDILLESNTIFVNGESADFNLNRPIAFSIFNAGNAGFNGKVSKVETDAYTLTPCQLTRNLFPHEIASSNTALRGECGFADKEKYKRGEAWFYGNRAKTGKFGVSDE